MVWKKLVIHKYAFDEFEVVTMDMFEHSSGSIIKVNHDSSVSKGLNMWVVKYFNSGSSGEWVVGRPKTRADALKMAKDWIKSHPNG